MLSWPEDADTAAVRALAPTATYRSLRERQADRAPPPDPAVAAAHVATKAQRKTLATKLGAISRTPPGRVIGWMPHDN